MDNPRADNGTDKDRFAVSRQSFTDALGRLEGSRCQLRTNRLAPPLTCEPRVSGNGRLGCPPGKGTLRPGSCGSRAMRILGHQEPRSGDRRVPDVSGRISSAGGPAR